VPWPEKLLADVRGGHLVDISSTDIRYRVAEGMSIRYLVSPAVDMYITEHSLYRR
jgi:nicotinate-nucleotide adenylyltransferase